MLTSAPGSKPPRLLAHQRVRGFTLIEIMVVVTIIAIGSALVSMTLRDGEADRLDAEALRLAALLDTARARARTEGRPVRWLPQRNDADATAPLPGEPPPAPGFAFVGLAPDPRLPTAWLYPETSAEVPGRADGLTLGPEPVIGPQQVVLRLGTHTRTLSTDGLGPFVLAQPDAAGAS